jgi:3-deoxy-manno-octulosonate cytidylyltransferase (CMP-KDO synthetase)
MIEHVRRRAALCHGFSEVVVATCDQEIAAVVEGYGGNVILTSASHPGATDRVAEAVRQLDCTHVINVQGDEVLVLPAHLAQMIRAMVDAPEVAAWNAVARLVSKEDLHDPSIVKCVTSPSGRILFCARRFADTGAGLNDAQPVRIVLGLLGYQRTFLDRYRSMARTPLETAETIDQMRIIEHDVVLRAVELPAGYPGINEPRDVPLVERLLAEDPAQQAVFSQVIGCLSSV